VRERKSRQARNPKTGGKVKVPKRRYPAFKPSKTLKDALKG
jgi:DNA-binding protein HU-beta